jgi:hypothetical protein
MDMIDDEIRVVFGLYLIAVALLFSLARFLHLSGVLVLLFLVVVLAPLPVLVLGVRRPLPPRVEMLAAYLSVAMFAVAVVASLMLVVSALLKRTF